MHSVLRYAGSKTKLAPIIISFFPRHITYVEVFGGSAAVLLRKPRSQVEVLNDIDGDLVNLYRVLRDPSLFGLFYLKIQLMPYSRLEHDIADTLLTELTDPVDRAVYYYIACEQSMSGIYNGSWRFSLESSRNNMALSVCDYLSHIRNLPEIHARLRGVQVECADWKTILSRYNTRECLLYLDPPYVPETRSPSLYKHEMTYEEHCELVDACLAHPGMIVLSGYLNELYDSFNKAGWGLRKFKLYSSMRIKKRMPEDYKPNDYRTECLWLSPSVMERLRKGTLFADAVKAEEDILIPEEDEEELQENGGGLTAK